LAVCWFSSIAGDQPANLVASWYGDECAQKPMANGRPFNPGAMTCASWFYPLGTVLKVTKTEDPRRWVIVKVTDRGPNKRLLRTRQIDLSRAAFSALAPLRDGLTRVIVERTGEDQWKPKPRVQQSP
jgi:rare lipoprotein A